MKDRRNLIERGVNMPKYADKSGRSGIASYQLNPADKSISVTFKNGGDYTYPLEGNDNYTISRMSAMAENGEYLNRMINHEKPKFVGQKGTPPSGDMRGFRKSDELAMRAIHNKYIYGAGKTMVAQLKDALAEKMKNAASYSDWKKLRGK